MYFEIFEGFLLVGKVFLEELEIVKVGEFCVV